MKSVRWIQSSLLGATLLLAVTAQAQQPEGTTGANDAGAITNATTTTTTTTTTEAVDAAPLVEVAPAEDTSLPNTGGEPWVMSLAGLTLAAGALLLRRRQDA